ncbi:MFS transporter [Fulvivirga sp. M361]|uniref:MFS transporter n=1 Tax=Fulvivirga sp. M361 TaxID=2594266 RepID=UPI001179C7C2|nr:MFS transporter [Fulvivirga sp. M361]TRX62124.1 MFS transporter [Fulvivirga sp. M361]
MELNNKKIINAWCMFDWANSVYSLVITSAIFPIYYTTVTTGKDGNDIVDFFGFQVVNTVLYSYSLSFSFLFVAAILPLLSGIADYSGKKKLFLKVFMYLGASSCIGLFFFTGENVEWAIICSIIASVGFSGGLVFYDAFLPEIASKDRLDNVSARGYSFGYIGSVILMIINLIMIEKYDWFGLLDAGVATRLAFLTVGFWWMAFSQITFIRLKDKAPANVQQGNLLTNGYKEILKVWKTVKALKVVKLFLMAFFFYNMGVQTVIYLAASFGSKELKMESASLILTILIIQLVAIAGAYLFSYVSARRGNSYSLILMVLIWMLTCVGAYFITTEMQFFMLAVVVGAVMGGIQSLSRATFAKLIPPDDQDHASYFSFYDVTYNLSIVIGTFSYGFIEQITNSMRNSVLVLIIFFVIGLVFLISAKIPFHKTPKTNQPTS